MSERIVIELKESRTRRVAAFCMGVVALIALPIVSMPAFMAYGRDPALAIFFVFSVGLLLVLIGIRILRGHRGWVELGREGVLVRAGAVARYVSFDRLHEVTVFVVRELGDSTTGVLLRLTESETVRIPIGGSDADAGAKDLAERIFKALEDYRRLTPHEQAIAALAPRGRSVDDWFAQLRRVREGAVAGFRESALPVERLWRVVESPVEDPGARAGAAVALGRCLDDSGKERLRIAAESTASPKLRIVMESVTTGDDEAILAALSAIEMDRETTPREAAARER